MSGGRPWTTGEARRLREMRSRRVPVDRIAAELDRSIDAIHSFLRYVPWAPGSRASTKSDRLPKRPQESYKGRTDTWTTEETERLKELASKGASAFDVAEAVGRTAVAVRCRASRLGVSFRRSSLGGRSQQGLEVKTRRHRRNAIEGSAALRDVIQATGVRP